jgi:hypothetical protein
MTALVVRLMFLSALTDCTSWPISDSETILKVNYLNTTLTEGRLFTRPVPTEKTQHRKTWSHLPYERPNGPRLYKPK